MKCANGFLRVLLKVVEVRGGVPVGNTVEDAEVQLQRLLNLVENAPHASGLEASGGFLDLAIGQQINVEFRPYPFEGLCQR